jgi:hypothetical protein
MPNQQLVFTDFLKKTFGQKEVALVIVKHEAEQKMFQKQLEQEGFKPLERPLRKAVALNYIIVKDQERFKEAYDFAVQSPLGQIQLWDEIQTKTTLIAQDPMHPTVFLLTKDTLAKIRQAGMDLLSKVGLTYQS